MAQLTLAQTMQMALERHQGGRLADAEALYRQILAVYPNYADALHMLGVLARQAGQPKASVELIRRTIQLMPGFAPAYLNLGAALNDLGQFDEAIAAYDRAIQLKPDYAEAYNNLASALRAKGQIDEAIAACRKTIELQGGYAAAHYNLGLALADKGQFDEAIVFYSQAIRLKPDYAEAHNNLGNVLKNVGKLDEAMAAYSKAAELNPNFALAYCNLGAVFQEKGQSDQAIEACRKALELKPDYTDAYLNLGVALRESGRLAESIAAFKSALRLRPDYAEAHNGLGAALLYNNQIHEAIGEFNNVIPLKPKLPEGYYNLGNALKENGQLDEASIAYGHALQLKPDLVEAHNNLGNVLRDQGRLGDAIAAYEKAIEINPEFGLAQSNLLYALYFHPDFTPAMILARHRQWAARFADPLAEGIARHGNDQTRGRRLKVGYVSPDFRTHPVGRFLYPLMAGHDRAGFEIHGYCDVRRPDALTALLRGHCDQWHETARLSDEALAGQIRRDGIDILVDLTLHMSGSRLLAFARKPAPVQVSWLGYAGTTGLKTMDYRLSDAYLDPPGSDADYVEQTWRIASYWCYKQDAGSLPIAPLPGLGTGHITFGCFNNFSKVTAPTLSLWIGVLRRVERSRLLIYARSGSHRERTSGVFAEAGIEPSRIEFVGMQALRDYLLQYQRVDIALDTTPYAGGTTTCDALWMGVPVVTLSGETAVGRGGVSILSQLGLTELIAGTAEEYIAIAARMAADLSKLAELRSTLRRRILASSLTDPKRFVSDIEGAYRKMWEQWRST